MKAYLIKHVDSGPGWAWTDNLAVFLNKDAAEAYLRRCRSADPDSDVEPEDDGWLDTNWWMEELPLGPEVLPVKEEILKPWKVPA